MIPDLTRNERAVFSAIYAQPDTCLAQIITATRLSRSCVERQIMRLEDMGLALSRLERVPLPDTGALCTQRLCTPAPWVLA